MAEINYTDFLRVSENTFATLAEDEVVGDVTSWIDTRKLYTQCGC